MVPTRLPDRAAIPARGLTEPPTRTQHHRWDEGVPVTEQGGYERSMTVQVRGLAKRFGSVQAVAGVDLDVRRGSMFGLVGPNGAGKTTTLAMVTGLLRPDAGGARVDGLDVWSHPLEVRSRMGVLPEGLNVRASLGLRAAHVHRTPAGDGGS